ncbi:MAG: oxidoreductase, partial [Planctomycetes bacterium]|nr:oxidoreductase [Planctomycetota bacterium]
MVSKTIKSEPITRRRVLKAGAVMPLAALVPVGVHRGRSTIRVGVIGCGGRGTGAARDCSKTEGVEIVAMGDLFADRMARSRKNLSERIGASYKVDDAHAFVGFDACDRVLACDVDLVILATPPAFRPQQLEKAINAGKHVFMEKPV